MEKICLDKMSAKDTHLSPNQDFKRFFKYSLAIFVSGAFALVAALSWSDACKCISKRIVPEDKLQRLEIKILYSIVLTIVVIIIIYGINYGLGTLEQVSSHISFYAL